MVPAAAFDEPATSMASPYGELAHLPLQPEEFEALRRQGFVHRETRGANFASFKLRFRVGGRQRVVYLGSDPRVAERIARHLAVLQQEVRRSRRLSAVLKTARQKARAIRRRSAAVLAELGLHYHGTTLRKTRGARGKQVSEPGSLYLQGGTQPWPAPKNNRTKS